MKREREELCRLLATGLIPCQAKVDRRRLEVLTDLCLARMSPGAPGDEADRIRRRLFLLIGALRDAVEQDRRSIQSMRARFEGFAKRYRLAESQRLQQDSILEFSKQLGESEASLRRDRRSFGLWFDYDAVVDRYRMQLGETEQRMAFAIDRLGAVSALLIAAAETASDKLAAWGQLRVESQLKPLLAYDGDGRVRSAAFRALTHSIEALPPEAQERAVAEDVLQLVFRGAADPRTDVWVQATALATLRTLSPSAFRMVLERRLSQPAAGDDIFFRRKAVGLLVFQIPRSPELQPLLDLVPDDPSPFVRQGLAEQLAALSLDRRVPFLRLLALEDSSPQVRASALLRIPRMLSDLELLMPALAVVRTSFADEKDPFVLRVLGKVAVDCHAELRSTDAGAADRWNAELQPCLSGLHHGAAAGHVRRWAAQASERLWCRHDEVAWSLHETLRPIVQAIRPGRIGRIPHRVLDGVAPEMLGRVLSVLAQDDFGLDVWRGQVSYRVARGDIMRFRLWRLFHEMRQSATDKRQAYRHTIGRVYRGTMSAPSAILAELAQTKVPGEPLYMSEEGGWRPYLPLSDHMLSAIDTGKPVRLYTSEGITEISVSGGFLTRLRARLRLSWEFSRFAQLRNWYRDGGAAPIAYLRSFASLGLSARIVPHGSSVGDVEPPAIEPTVARFFPALLPLSEAATWERFVDYFSSVYENSLRDLILFLAAAAAVFFGRHIYMNQRLHWARRGIPLVLGGWGTRGKSGTERLKAAVINALGYGLVSKTTGCEAMFLYAPAFGELREMFLFRPYDKATIWEQFNVTVLARKLGSDVMLWECMALNPAFVQLMQRHWMRDDIATLTNTYPDHEDIQGPAGRDIPQVMVNFIPRNGRLITSEEQMLPILREGAKSLGAAITSVGWLEAGLLTDDVLKRFPYEEHPYNIALVAAMSAELGLERDFVLKEMADRVVPDLGVLKAYPVATLRRRRLEFVNGMSANERFGCLSNWKRMGFDIQDPEQEPGVWLTTVVNNRADRVARSRVFASVIVDDLSADRHFLIGSNLEGLQGFIGEAWNIYAGSVTLWPESGGDEAKSPVDVLLRLARRLRIAHGERQVEARFGAMLSGLDIDLTPDERARLLADPARLESELASRGIEHADVLARHVAAWRSQSEEYAAFAAKLTTAGDIDRARADAELRQLLSKWFHAKVVVVHDFYATGNQIVDQICEETPPGFLNRIMGIQNIKGTGLDFVYRWQAWLACHRLCAQLRGEDASLSNKALEQLVSFQEHGRLTQEHVRETIAAVRSMPHARAELFQAQLAAIETNLDRRLAELEGSGSAAADSGFLTELLGKIEEFLDSGDAVRRRRRADTIYKEMIGRRISADRAILELQDLTKRQKGGWLRKSIKLTLSQSIVVSTVRSLFAARR
jgi:poly-gamma-glutamate synthase PgsB/CapB